MGWKSPSNSISNENYMTKLKLGEIAVISKNPTFSPYGYVITEDGTIYSLIEQWCHGVILALIFPELAKENGYTTPDENYDVFKYQQFELDHSRETTAIRVSMSPMSGQLNISKGEQKSSPEQCQALAAIIKEQGLSQSNTLQCDMQEMTIHKFMNKLWKGKI